MEESKLKRRKNVVLYGIVVMVLAFTVALPISAQQPQGQEQQQQGGLNLNAEPGLPASCTQAVYTQDGGEKIQTGKSYTSTASGVIESTVHATNGGWLTLQSPKIKKTGKEDGDYGGQAVEAAGHSMINLLDAEIFTDTKMANGIWATEGSLVCMKGGSITAKESGGHGIDVTKRASVVLYDVKISTDGQSASGALVNDAGDGSIYATKVIGHTKGPGSSGFYMIGEMSTLILTDSTLTAETSEGGVAVHGPTVTITNSNITGANGIKVAGGDVSISGGSVTATAGVAFYVGGGEGGVPSGNSGGGQGGGAPPNSGMPGGTRGTGGSGGPPGGGMPGGGLLAGVPGLDEIDSDITIINGTKISATGNLITVADDTDGSFTVQATELEGDVEVGEESDFAITLTNSSLTGAVNGAALTLGANSKWIVTGDSVLTSLKNEGGISGTSIANIVGNGHTVTYDKELSEDLGGKTYTLTGGGKLVPKK